MGTGFVFAAAKDVRVRRVSEGACWKLEFAPLGVGLLLKGLIAAVFLVVTGLAWEARTWRRIRPFRGALIVLLIAAP
ncbi:MAG: hypothetical protein SGI92_21615 [Bryobacteraceae bacterium]|nr:hypothetical protein [Bryobacteraceae bacterium]